VTPEVSRFRHPSDVSERPEQVQLAAIRSKLEHAHMAEIEGHIAAGYVRAGLIHQDHFGLDAISNGDIVKNTMTSVCEIQVVYLDCRRLLVFVDGLIPLLRKSLWHVLGISSPHAETKRESLRSPRLQ
jgi:hypothetical protein